MTMLLRLVPNVRFALRPQLLRNQCLYSLKLQPPSYSNADMSGKYIVVFKQSATDDEINKHCTAVENTGGKIDQKYDSIMKGFSATITDQYLTQLQSLQGGIIDYIEPDGQVKTQ